MLQWRVEGRTAQDTRLGGLALRPKQGPETKDDAAGRVHVVTDASEVLFLPGAGSGSEAELRKRCDARDPQGSCAPSSLIFDATDALFLADFAKMSIISQRPTSPEQDVETLDQFDLLVSEYEGAPFCGPNSMAFDAEGNLFFTDSGPMGETSLGKPKGSVFCVEVADQLLKPLALECLAHPCGVAVSADGRLVYVAEMMANRILRFVKQKNGVFLSSVFHQFSGGFGPSSLCCYRDPTTGQEYLFVARFDFAPDGTATTADGNAGPVGTIAVLKDNGELSGEFPGPPELGPELISLLVAPAACTDPGAPAWEEPVATSEMSVYATAANCNKICSASLTGFLPSD